MHPFLMRNTFSRYNCKTLLKPHSMGFSNQFDASAFDKSQVAQLEDSLTQVDENDNVIGPVSKLNGHLKKKDSRQRQIELPHRAFSLFLFNQQNQLLLQQRSLKKITFPNLWTNTCCSHPRHVEDEIDLGEGYIGPRRAAIRRTQFELNISDLELKQLTCVSKILYYADSDDTFAEYELDYIIFAKTDVADFTGGTANLDEVKAVKWVGLDDIDKFLNERKERHGEDITPWFKLLKERKLMGWWRNLIEKDELPNESGHIERFID